MTVELLTATGRWALAAAAVALLGVALALRRRAGAAAEIGRVLAVTLATLAVLLLAAERLIAAGVRWAAPAGADFNEWRWVLEGPWGRVGMAAGFVACLATVVLAWRGTSRERRLARRVLLVSLRAGACTAALILFLQPSLELRHVTREPNHVVILVDDSRSMELAERAGEPTRLERAASLVRRSAGTFDAWRRDHILDFYTFSDGALPASEQELAAGIRPHGDATRLREALEQIRARYDGHDLAGVVVVSDGVATGRFADGVDDGASLDFLQGLGTRVHTVWAGRKGLVDLSVARIDAEEFAFVRTAFKVDAILRAAGMPSTEVAVTLSRDGAPVKTSKVQIGGARSEARATFEVVPERIGKYVYEVSVPIQEGEAVRTNNARSFVVRVIRDKVRVLQVAGRPSWDERALRGYFKADPNVDLISFFILRTHDDISAVHPDEMALIPFPTEELFEEQLGSFDVVVMMNFEYGPYQIGPYLENIRAYVEQGGALAMIGGDLAYSSGDYYGTPLADALPVELLPGSKDDPRLVSTEEFQPRLTVEGRRHPIMQLRFDRHDNELRWGSLPDLEGLNLTAGARPNATVLAEHPSLRGRNGKALPVVVVGEHGQGRTMSLMTDSSWRWGFMAAGTTGDDGRAYAKFWENAVRWLIRDPELEYLQVETDQAEYPPGGAPRVRAHLVDKDYQPARGAEIVVQVVGAEGRVMEERKLKTDESGDVRLDLKPMSPGAYRVAGRARVGERRVTAEDVFLIGADRAELEQPAAREDVLAGVASATGGAYLGPAGELPDDLPLAPPRVVRVDRRSDLELWSRPYLFVLALLLLGLEWGLRKRSGYL